MNLETLKAKRQNWVNANRENDFEDGIKRLLTELYPDNAHFIYELLQNAEDPEATTVRFTLTENSVEFEHNGKRLFTLKDVESITSIANSTKRDDPTSIGKFGVGFKAVFAYTHTPEIESGEYHFHIRDLVVPEPLPRNQTNNIKHLTRINLPFDHPVKKAVVAAKETEQGLRALADNTLLFLTHIRKIEYLLPDGSFGTLERIDHQEGQIEIRSSHPGGQNTVSHWLNYHELVQVTDETGKTAKCRISIAYQINSQQDQKDSTKKWRVLPLDHGQVSIYFPAEKETSNLKFHIHAPFASTVARDSIRDCAVNCELRDHIAALVVKSVHDIKEKGLLTVQFLSVLPNESDLLSEFYEPIRLGLIDAFKNEPLVPTKSGTHAEAGNLYRGKSKISEILGDEGLSLLVNYSPPLWTANPPQKNQRGDKFLESLDIDDFDFNELVYAINQLDDRITNLEEWLQSKEDSFLFRFYALIGEASDESYLQVYLKDALIVRIDSNNGLTHVAGKDAFFPPEKGKESPDDLNFVKDSVYIKGNSENQKAYARSFLNKIGVRPYDAKTQIQMKLDTYFHPKENISRSHYQDIKNFIKYWKKNLNEVGIFRKRNFILGCDPSGDLFWTNPDNIFIDSPYFETNLYLFQNIHQKLRLPDIYEENLGLILLNDFRDFLKAIGAIYELKIETAALYHNPNYTELYKDTYGTRTTYTSISEDYTIPKLRQYTDTKSVEASKLIWHALIKAKSTYALARYRPNQQYSIRSTDSQLVHHLKLSTWIPDNSGHFHKPQDIGQEQLPKDFPYDDRNGLLTAIEFGLNVKRQSEEYQKKNNNAQILGFDSAEEAEGLAIIAKEAKERGITVKQLLSTLSQQKKPIQPTDSVMNPERRRRGVQERKDNAPPKESIIRERSIQPGAAADTLEAKAYLRAKYSNIENQLICQCCQEEMPFKIKDEYYFEAVQCVLGMEFHHFENRLALCPLCAAMYKHANQTESNTVRQLIVDNNAEDTAPEVEITVRLADTDRQIRFVGSHWFDLKTILEE